MVTKSFAQEGIIIGGNPAKKISTWGNFEAKNKNIAQNISGLTHEEKVRLLMNDKNIITNK